MNTGNTEERILKRYQESKKYSEELSSHSSFQEDFNKGVMRGIIDTLNIYNIKIKGIN